MRILVIDNYDSFTFNLIQMLRRVGGVDIIVEKNDKIDRVLGYDCDGILISPGPGLPDESGFLTTLIAHQLATKPMLGVCLGHQALATSMGGSLVQLSTPRHGQRRRVSVIEPHERLFKGLPERFDVGLYHSWSVSPAHVPPDLQVIALDDDGTVMAIRHRVRPAYGVQFHIESVMTPLGGRILGNWLEIVREIDRG